MIERVQAAVVLHDDPAVPFRRVGLSAYYHRRKRDEVIDLDGIVLGHAFKEEGLWHYDRSLWDF